MHIHNMHMLQRERQIERDRERERERERVLCTHMHVRVHIIARVHGQANDFWALIGRTAMIPERTVCLRAPTGPHPQGRNVYITPTSYLELLSSFANILDDKRKQALRRVGETWPNPEATDKHVGSAAVRLLKLSSSEFQVSSNACYVCNVLLRRGSPCHCQRRVC